MRKTVLLKLVISVFTAVMCLGLQAQHEFILDPSKLIPHDTGYYIGGIWKDLVGDDGIPEFYNGCFDAYGDASHNESGVQQGFTYEKCMIMPDCPSKDEPTNVAVGYIEIGKTRYVGTDSARLCYIISPSLVNLSKIYLEVSPDVSSQTWRHIWYYFEYSKDNGETWELTYIKDETVSKKGDIKTYDGSLYFEFEEMKEASEAGPIVLRLMSGEQRVKVHLLKITADEVTSGISVKEDPVLFKVYENLIIASEGKISVYNPLGQLVGSGESVYVPNGIYIVKTSDGHIKKVYIE